MAAIAVAAGLALSSPRDAPAQTAACEGGVVCAGVGVADATWRVGASAGQYAGAPEDDPFEFVSHEAETFDPTGLSTRRKPSYGVQSRLSVRAIVVDGPAAGAGDRVAILKNDLYIPQDLVYRRAGQILELECPECGITAENLSMAVTHNHSSPFYSSTSWGVWAFQDVFDIRFFEYMARQMAEAVREAAGGLRPVRVGARSTYYDKTHRHSFGPAIADDGTPAGYPQSDTDHDMTVIRFDDVSDPSEPKPLANLVNFSQHPEFLEGNDIISADYLGPFERMLDRETGAVTIFTQGAVGTSEPERSSYHSIHERLEFTHRDYAQAEWGARLMADAAKGAWQRIADDAPAGADDYLSFDDFGAAFEVGMIDEWYPGPLTHPYPGVSNCRTDSGLAGDPLIPIVGLPDCEDLDGALGNIGAPGPDELGLPAPDPGLSTDDFQAAGIPVPENYGAPAYTGLEEDIDVHLQAIRLGDLLLPVCSCEQWWDQSRNIELRTNKTPGDETLPGNLGYDWGAQCTQDGNGTYEPDGSGTGTWRCPNPGNPSVQLPYALTDREVKRMRAQVNNPANGWNDLENVLHADSEPVDATQIKGNFTHDDTAANAAKGYAMTIPISMANDYNGYIASYREFQRGDHYRKALTGWGPHSSDYMASRLATLGRLLNDPAHPLPADQQLEADVYEPKVAADLAVNEARALALGAGGTAAIAAFEAGLPDDGGDAEVVSEPDDIERFDAAFFEWNGGSNYTDDPMVRVEREISPGQWALYADQSGEIPVTLEYPSVAEGAAPYAVGGQRWHWTARFEAFVAGQEDEPINTGDRAPATPPGTYRFVVEGERREGGAVAPYELTSREFEVDPWRGITVEDLRLEEDGVVSFRIGPRSVHEASGRGIKGMDGPAISAEIGPIDYPDTHPDPAPFIRNRREFARDPAAPADPQRLEWFCFTCTWRPWLDFGDAETARVTVGLPGGRSTVVPAARAGDRWRTSRALRPGESAQVREGDVLDRYGNTNRASQVIRLPAGEAPGTGPRTRCSVRVVGTSGPDRMRPTANADLFLGLGGNDRIKGGGGDDCLFGGKGGDRVWGGTGSDRVRGGDGPDRVGGGPGSDAIAGGRGSDRIWGAAGNDFIRAADRGSDGIRCGPGFDRVVASRSDRIARNCERVKRIGRKRPPRR